MKFNFKEFKDGTVKFFKSVGTEWKKITWPTPAQLKTYTIVVLATLLVITGFLWVVSKCIDFGLNWLGISGV